MQQSKKLIIIKITKIFITNKKPLIQPLPIQKKAINPLTLTHHSHQQPHINLKKISISPIIIKKTIK
jgi:hypothetical protein